MDLPDVRDDAGTVCDEYSLGDERTSRAEIKLRDGLPQRLYRCISDIQHVIRVDLHPVHAGRVGGIGPRKRIVVIEIRIRVFVPQGQSEEALLEVLPESRMDIFGSNTSHSDSSYGLLILR